MHQHKIKCVFLPARPGDEDVVVVNSEEEEEEKVNEPEATLQGVC
jgi:hypothetical protein